MAGVAFEGILGAVLTGLMVLLFLARLAQRDRRRPQHSVGADGRDAGAWVTGQTINIMTLGGLALAVGILVDEATVEVENIHTQMACTDSVAVAVRRGNSETAVPRLLAMLCILAVFTPMFFMEGAAQEHVRAAGAGRRLLDDHLVHPVEHVCAGRFRLAAQGPAHGRAHRSRLILRDRLMSQYERSVWPGS